MIQTITVCELTELQRSEALQLVDVRSASEFKTGHLAGAVNIPLDELESRIADLARQVRLILVCQGGVRAEMAAKCLANCHDKMWVLQGGVKAWKEAGRPLVLSAKTRWSLERQTRFGAGAIVLFGLGLGITVHLLWLGLAAFVGLGLTIAGLTDVCPMGILLSKMPWNQSVRVKPQIVSQVTDGQACALRR